MRLDAQLRQDGGIRRKNSEDRRSVQCDKTDTSSHTVPRRTQQRRHIITLATPVMCCSPQLRAEALPAALRVPRCAPHGHSQGPPLCDDCPLVARCPAAQAWPCSTHPCTCCLGRRPQAWLVAGCQTLPQPAWRPTLAPAQDSWSRVWAAQQGLSWQLTVLTSKSTQVQEAVLKYSLGQAHVAVRTRST